MSEHFGEGFPVETEEPGEELTEEEIEERLKGEGEETNDDLAVYEPDVEDLFGDKTS